MIVAKPDWENITTIKVLLRGFNIYSGLSVNFHKSRIFGVNIKSNFMRAALNYLLCSIYQRPFSFLGILIGCNPRRSFT